MVGGEAWSQVARRGHRGGRAAGRAGGGSEQSMAEWIDSNLPAGRFAKLSSLAQAGNLTTGVVQIVKRVQKLGMPLNKGQLGNLMKELDGAGEWDKTAAPAAHVRSAAATTNAAKGPAARVSSAPRGRAETVPAPAVTAQPRRRARRAARAMAKTEAGVADAGASQDDNMAVGAKLVWTCQECTTPHQFVADWCKLCRAKRVATAEVAAASTADSVEGRAARADALQALIDAMVAAGVNSTAAQSNIGEMKGQIAMLRKPVIPTPQPSRKVLIQNASDAMEAAQKRSLDLAGKLQTKQAKIEQLSTERELLERAMVLALSAQQAAEACYNAVLQAGATATASGGPDAAPAVLVAHASLLEALQHTLVAQLRTQHGLEDGVQAKMLEVARVSFEGLFEQWGGMFQMAQLPRAATGAAAPATPKAPAARAAAAPSAAGAVGGALLEPRVPIQAGSMARRSAAQEAKEKFAERQRGENREAEYAGRRDPEAGEAENKAVSDAEEAGDLSGDGLDS